MARRADFITILQTIMLARAASRTTHEGLVAGTMAEALRLPEDALPANLGAAARAFADYCETGRPPWWLMEHRENESARHNEDGRRLDDYGDSKS